MECVPRRASWCWPPRFTLGSRAGRVFLCLLGSLTHSLGMDAAGLKTAVVPARGPPSPEDSREARRRRSPGPEARDLPEHGPEG